MIAPIAPRGTPARVCLAPAPSGTGNIENQTQLIAWVRGALRDSIPHQHALLLFGSAHSLGITIEEFLCVDLPYSYIATIRNAAGHIHFSVLSTWQAERVMQFVDLTTTVDDIDLAAELRSHGLYNCLTDGLLDTTSMTASFVTLFNVAPEARASRLELRTLGVEPAHAAWLQIRESIRARTRLTLTSAELEVLKWVRMGKSNGEIARILGKRMFTVRNQVHTLLEKTGVTNRTLLAQVKV